MSNWRGLLLAFLWTIGTVSGVSAADFAAEGEKQLSLGNTAKAVTYLEAALAQGEPTEPVLLNLGLAYQKSGKGADARKAFRQGAGLQGPLRPTFLLNLGVSSFLAQDWPGAEAAYSEALADNPVFAEALLNRANTRLNTQDWAGAAADYRAYQASVPANPQKDKIDQVIALLDQAALEAQALRLAEETRKKKAAEEQAAADAAAEAAKQAAAAAEAQKQADAAAEAQRQAEAAAEAQRKAEAEAEARRQAEEAAAAAERAQQEAILAKIRESLAGASDDSKALSTGPSNVKTDSGDFSLDN